MYAIKSCGRSKYIKTTLIMTATLIASINAQSLINRKLKYTQITPAEQILQSGYPSETHLVTTDDGYILTFYRIPGPVGATPVYIQHGYLESSADWLLSGRNNSIDRGYDVWLGNFRGNTFSKMHRVLSTADPEFWDFGWDDIGNHDIPAGIAYITRTTNKTLFYVGHSMGCSTFAVMASTRPEIARNVRAMVSLAPAVYIDHLKQPLFRLISPFTKEIQFVVTLLKATEFFGRNALLDFFANHVCTLGVVGNFICSNVVYFLSGYDPHLLPKGWSEKIFAQFPAGTSYKVFLHLMQQIQHGEFRRFDYGNEGNSKVYGSPEPPHYNLSNIQVPMALIWSDNDWYVGRTDAKRFYEQLPNKLGIYKVEVPNNHLDFLWGIDAPRHVYSKILDLFSQFKD